MRNLTTTKTIAALGALAAAAWGGQAFANEPGGSDPHLPGVSDGAPGGFLPPPGVYFANTLAYNDASVQDNNGHNIGINAIAYIEIPGVTWVTPLHFLGASFAVSFAQPLVTLSVTSAAGTQTRTGVFNSVITPAALSWKLPAGFFVSASLPIYLQDGDTGDRGNGTLNNQHIANNTWTIAPSAAVSWFNGHGFLASLNGEYDIQTQNGNFSTRVPVGGGVTVPGQIKYQTGDFLNLDFTAVQTLPGAYKKWTVGAVGFYSVQVNDDQTTTSITGDPAVQNLTQTVANNRFERFGLGPYIGYDFGPVFTNFWYTRDVVSNNAAGGDTFFFQLVIPL
jgi:hypothetical protein